MKPVPVTKLALENEALGLGLLSPDPKKREKALEDPRGKLISYIYNSYKSRRGLGHVSMMLIGNSGIGKSSTINHLLGVELASISDSTSETKATTEYLLKTSDSSLAASDLTLGVIDTPGFNDTEGIAQDACNLACIEKFIQNHPQLKQGAFPNVVLVMVQATDSRFEGENSGFSKALKAAKKLGIFDRQNPNVVVVLTWACSLPNRNAQKWKAKMEAKGQKINSILLKTVGVQGPVVFIENNFEDEELPVEGECTRLPDGTLQPKNLVEAINSVMTKCNDDFGRKCLLKHFAANGKNVNVQTGLISEAKDAKKQELSSRESEFKRELEQNASVGALLPPVTMKINDYINAKGSNLSEDDINEALSIGTDLVERIGLLTLQDVKQYSVGNLCQLFHRQPSPFGVRLLKDVFDLKTTMITPNAILCVGKGYNILNDEFKPAALFKMDEETLQDTPFGIKVPKGVTMDLVNESATFMEHFEDEGEYVANRLQQLNLSLDVDYKMFSMKSRGGFTRSSKKETDFSHIENSFLYERRLFKLEIQNWDQETSGLALTDSFKNAVATSLPNAYDSSNPDNRREYEDFFSTWGHFAVASAYGGGTVEVKTTTMKVGNKQEVFLEARAELEATFKTLNFGVGVGTTYTDEQSSESTRQTQLSTSNLKWSGGDSQHHVASISSADPDKWRRWLASLSSNPAILSTNMSLIPIHSLVSAVAVGKVQGCRDALHDFLGGQFTVFKDRETRAKELEEELKEAKTRQEIAEANQPKPPSGGGCFPGNAKITVMGKGQTKTVKTMEDLQVGNKVLAFDPVKKRFTFSKVFMFNHVNKTDQTEFITLTLDKGQTLSLSPRHILFVLQDDKIKSVLAQDLSIGQLVQTGQGSSRIVKIRKEVLKGFYAPITLQGTILVNDVLASCYCEVEDKQFAWLGKSRQMSGHEVAHVSMGILRLVHNVGLGSRLLEIPEGQDMPRIISWATDKVLPKLNSA